MRLYDDDGNLLQKPWYFIREAQGVINFVGGDNPSPLKDVEIERSFLEVSSPNYDASNIPEHVNYLPRKQAAQYLGISESTLTRYHLKGRLKWITRRNRTPIYKRETLDNFKEKNKGKLLS